LTLIRSVLGLVAVLGAVPPASGQDVKSVLAAAEKAYHASTSFRADFTQTIENPMLGAPETTRGVMFLNPPDRFAMRFSVPKGDRIVADGKWLWAFTPSSIPDQVIRQPIPKGGTNTPNLIAQFVDRPLERYNATLVGSDLVGGTAVHVVKLVPKFADQPFTQATISIGKSDGLLRRLALVEQSGQKRLIVLPAPVVGATIPKEEFEFRAPKGVKVVTP
jgi:outer membrane lipoprotein carrier protein